MFGGVSVYFNYTGEAKCLNLGQEDDIGGNTATATDRLPAPGAGMWSYQSCTEMVMPFCFDGENDMFEKQEWDLEAYSKQCMVSGGSE